MSARRQWMIVAGIVAVLGGGAAVAVRSLGSEFRQITVGSRAPDFSAVTVDSSGPQTRTLADYRGQVVILNVWGTFCAPCRVEMPSMQRLYEEYRDKGVRLVAVSVDAPGMQGPIRNFAREFGLTFDILYDSRGFIQRDYTTTGVPETFVIGKGGTVRFKHVGPREWDDAEIRALLDMLLAEPGGG